MEGDCWGTLKAGSLLAAGERLLPVWHLRKIPFPSWDRSDQTSSRWDL